MEPEFICISGISLYEHEGFQSPYNIQQIYPFTDFVLEDKYFCSLLRQKWNFSQKPSDIVVINIGTNDAYAILFTDEKYGEIKFETEYYRFIENVRRLNGNNTHILCTLGPMNYYLYDNIVNTVNLWKQKNGDSRIYSFKFPPIGPRDKAGAGCHPSVKCHKRMANELTSFIRAQHIL